MDQYNDYNRLPLLLKRFGFDDKMSRLFYTSQYAQKLWLTGANEKKASSYLPWVLEQLCMLFVDSQHEYGNQKLDERQFVKIYNTAYDQSAEFFQFDNKDAFSNDVIQELGLTQFMLSQRDSILWYRHNWVFSYCRDNVDIGSLFIEKFNTSYIDYVQMAYACNLLSVMPDAHMHWAVYTYVFKVCFPQCMPALTILRAEYIKLNQRYSSDNIQNYAYCVRPSYQYAFVQENESLYFPLPHLLTRNITSGFMYRLTEGNNNLRRDIGKYVWEEYLFSVVDGSRSYDEVFAECKYTSVQGGEAHSPDVLARCGEDIVLFECKSTVPRMDIRWLVRDEIMQQVSRIAEYVKQLYKQMKVFDRYNPFAGVNASTDHLWGIVVLQEDPYVSRRSIYEKAADLLNISLESNEYQWLVRHIKVVDLYEIESLHLFGNNCVDILRELTDEARVYDVGFPATRIKDAFMHAGYADFCAQRHAWSESLKQKLREGGYLK